MFANFNRPCRRAPPTIFLIWCIFALTRISFKLLALRNPVIGTFLKNLLRSWLVFKRRCIPVIMCFNWAREMWYVTLKKSVSSLSFFLWLFSSSALENFLAFKICFRNNLSLYLLPLSQISRSLDRLSKN